MYLISKDHLPLEEILDNSNNKLASTRFVSSISSTTSSALKYDESPQIDQPSSFHTFDFYYGRLVVRLHLLQSKLLVSNEYCNTFTTTTSRKRIPRKTGYHQCVGYLLANSRIRLDDTYVESFLRVFSIFTNRHQIETSARRLALEEIAMMFN
ncbi:unnamed protein product [Rotaria magnacalcarata]|uniref:Uncharacterized protein n=1 Tax=Rotaria magnacalcarata TaxID=392030 RepID=A0A819AKB1_9BILA|nr:unnamed protein product [Rotaria magnacalcarata]CAF4062683.1 unnamed protein product [Rotaria magnacalcarata]